MFSKLSEKSDPKRILVVSMTNIGDVVLSCPVIDILREDFPRAKIDVVIGPKAVSLFADNPNLSIKVFNKQGSLSQKFAWFSGLTQAYYDCVVDLRHTMLPFFLWPRYATPVLFRKSSIGHKKEAHLNRLRQVYDFDHPSQKQCAILTTKEDEQLFKEAIEPELMGKDFVVIAPGAASSDKRWHTKGFAAVADYLSATKRIVFVGDAKDVGIIKEIQDFMKASSVNLAGKINLRQLAFVLKKSSWAMTHDSGVMHLASYFNVPLVVLWGPTDINKYAPWCKKSVIVRRNEECRRCFDPKAKAAHNCMSFIQVEDVIGAVGKIQ